MIIKNVVVQDGKSYLFRTIYSSTWQSTIYSEGKGFYLDNEWRDYREPAIGGLIPLPLVFEKEE